MSRISDVRSRILQLKIFSRLRLCAGERSSSKITVSTSCRRQTSANSPALPLPMNVAGLSDTTFCQPSPMTSPPAVAASSPSSASESRVSARLRDLSSTPTRKTRSGRFFLVSMSAFNFLRTERLSDLKIHHGRFFCFVQHAHVEAVVNDQRLRRDAVHDEHVAANRAAGPNDGFAAKNRRAGINRNAVLNRRVPVLAAQLLSASGGFRAERDAMIHLHVVADDGGFANNRAGAMVHEKVRPDLRARMQVHARARMRPLDR